MAGRRKIVARNANVVVFPSVLDRASLHKLLDRILDSRAAAGSGTAPSPPSSRLRVSPAPDPDPDPPWRAFQDERVARRLQKAQCGRLWERYVAMKKQVSNEALLFWNFGGYYQVWFQDAVTVSRELKIPLTWSRDQRSIPGCYFPVRSVEIEIAYLISRGYSVALLARTDAARRVTG